MPPKWEKSTDDNQNLISSQGGQDTSACRISGHSTWLQLKKESTLSLMSPQRLNENVKLKKKKPKIQNCDFGQIWYVCLSNHLDISSRKIESCCNNNSDEESTFNFSHYMDTRQSERCKLEEIAKIQILEFFTKLNARHNWSLLRRCVNMKWVRLVL